MLFDLTVNTNSRKIMTLNPSYPQDVTKTVIKGNTVSATFSVQIAEAGVPAKYTYQWYVNGTAVSGATSSTYTRTGLSATATYTVYCEVTNAAGTVRSREATLKVTQYYTPVLNTSYPANVTGATVGSSATFKVAIATAGVPESYTYQWYVRCHLYQKQSYPWHLYGVLQGNKRSRHGAEPNGNADCNEAVYLQNWYRTWQRSIWFYMFQRQCNCKYNTNYCNSSELWRQKDYIFNDTNR